MKILFIQLAGISTPIGSAGAGSGVGAGAGGQGGTAAKSTGRSKRSPMTAHNFFVGSVGVAGGDDRRDRDQRPDNQNNNNNN